MAQEEWLDLEDIEELRDLDKKYNKVEIEAFWEGGIKFDSHYELARIYKCNEDAKLENFLKEWFPEDLCLVLKDIKEFNDLKQSIVDQWDNIPPMTAKEAFGKYADNAEHRMVILSQIDPGEVLSSLDAELIDEARVTKRQKKTFFRDGRNEHDKNSYKNVLKEDLYTVDITYEDVISLYRVKKHQIGITDTGTMNDWQYFVKVEDTSTKFDADREDLLLSFDDDKDKDNYVAHLQEKSRETPRTYYLYVEESTNAKDAIASTFRKPDGSKVPTEEYFAMVSET